MLIKAQDIKTAIQQSSTGRSGKNVYAKNASGQWKRIIRVSTANGLVYGTPLTFGSCAPFAIDQWEER